MYYLADNNKMNLILISILFVLNVSVFGASGLNDFSRKDHIIVIKKNFKPISPMKWKTAYKKATKGLFKSSDTKPLASGMALPLASIKSGNVPKKKENFEMVFFDYSKEGKSEKKKTNKKIKKNQKQLAQKSLKPQTPTLSIAGSEGANLKKKEFIDYTKLLSSAYNKSSGSNFKIMSTLYGIKENVSLSNYEMIPYYNFNERLSDMGSGEIQIAIGTNGSSVFRGLIQSSDNYPVNFEISVEANEIVSIPSFTYEKIEKILIMKNVKDITGSHLLIALNEEVDSTQLETKYSEKVFLNERMKIVDEGSDYIYELYLNVEPGNQLLKFMNRKGKIAEKIIHLSESEMTYDESSLTGKKTINFRLFEENLTSKKYVPVNVNEKSVKLFNSNKSAVKDGLNSYKLFYDESINSFNNYFELQRKRSLYIGTKSRKIIVPSDEYLDYVLKLFNIAENSPECIIQINLSKPASGFELDVKSTKINGSVDVLYMDKDGTVGRELTGLTERVFVISSDFGAVNFKTTLGKDDTRYHQSFCSESLYLLEQI